MTRFLKVLIWTFLLVPSVSVMAEEVGDVLVLELKPDPTAGEDAQNRKLIFKFTDTPKVSFSETELTVSSETIQFVDESYSYGDVIKMFFDSDPSTGVNDVVWDKLTQRVRFTDGMTLIVEGIDGRSVVRAFALDGKSVSVSVDRMDQGVTVHLDSLQDGIYVIMIGNQRYKVVRK